MTKKEMVEYLIQWYTKIYRYTPANIEKQKALLQNLPPRILKEKIESVKRQKKSSKAKKTETISLATPRKASPMDVQKHQQSKLKQNTLRMSTT